MVGNGIKWVRKQRGISQSELAKRIETSQSNLSQVEGELRNASIGALEVLAEELETHLVLFFWFGIEREELDDSVKTKYDILKPSVDELLKEIFF